jgi:hypothetical protein
VPLRVTFCGLPPALSLTLKVPALAPDAAGSKNTPIAQLAPAATVFPQALSEPKSAGLVVTLLMLSVAVPVLVSVTVCGRLDVPTYCAAKVRLPGDKPTIGPGVLPVKAMACGLPGALSVTLIAAAAFPFALGVKVTLTWQLAFAVSGEVQVLVWANSLAFNPVTAIFEIVNVALPVLVKAIACDGLVVPTACTNVRTGGPVWSACHVPCNSIVRLRLN